MKCTTFHHKDPSCWSSGDNTHYLLPAGPVLPASTHGLLILIILLFQEHTVDGITQWITFGDPCFFTNHIPQIFAHVVSRMNCCPFLRLSSKYSIAWVDLILLNRAPPEGHLGCLQFLLITNKTAINIRV